MMNTDSIDFSAEIGVLSSLAHTERDLAQGVTRWILSNFRSDVATAVQHTPFTPALLCAIACREAGAFWLPLTPNRPAAEILGLCVYDASGDVPGAPRTAFPVNTSAFRLAYGEDFTNLLIQETNKARAARGLSEAAMVYKGYGIFQYDLQHVRTDESFFRARQWHSFAECVSRAVAELKKKYDVTHDIQDAVRAYNGSGPRAEQYARDVMRILPYCEEAAGGIQGAPPLMTAQVRHRELDPALSQLPAAVAPSEDDPAAPSPGEISETADLASAITFANTGSGNIIDDTDFFSALRSLAPAASPRLPLDLAKAQAFLSACVNSHPRVTYGLGAKAPFLAAVPGRDFTKIDCSGFIRQLIRLSTTPMVAFPDGSVVQHDWIRARGFEKGTVEDGFKHDDLVRIAFLRPQDTASRIGHVLLVHAGVSMESHGGTGPDSRPWSGTGWQAKTFVYVLAKL